MKDCPDCSSDLHPIKLLDATVRDFQLEGSQHTVLRYAAPNEHQSMFMGKIKGLGEVGAHVCSGCGRIFLYAKPDSEKYK